MTATRTYIAVAGDYLVKIAQKHATTWQAIWNHPANAAHRQRRGSPDVLYAGDVLQIPAASHPDLPPLAPPSTPPPAIEPPALPPGPPSWPYGPPPGELVRREPRWSCQTGLCECHPGGELEVVTHTIFLHDDYGRRMPGARCRVHGGGVHTAPPYAAADGSLAIQVGAQVDDLLVEWAPPDTPLAGPYPFRHTYALDVDGDTARQAALRLANLGFTRATTLSEQVEAFQRSYALPIDGEPASALAVLLAYHDLASLPPLHEVPDPARPGEVIRKPASPPGPPDPRPPSQGCLAAIEDHELRDCHFSFIIFDERSQKPLGQASYVIDSGSSVLHYGVTDGGGRIDFGDVPGGDYFLRIAGVTMTVPAIAKTEASRPLLLIPNV